MPLASDYRPARAEDAPTTTATANGKSGRHHHPIKPPVPTSSSPKPPCGLRSDVDWLASNKAQLAAAALEASMRRATEDERLRTNPPPRSLDGKDERATEFWLRGKPGYGKVPGFCAVNAVGGGCEGVNHSNSKAKRPGSSAAAKATPNPTTTTTPATTAAATPLPDHERLALLSRAKARHAALAAQYGRLPLCFAADTPSGLRRREQLGKALDQARADVEALEKAAQVVVVGVAPTPKV